ATRRALAAEAQTDQDPPYLALAVSTAELLLDQLADTTQRPQLGGKSLRQSSFLEQLAQFDLLLRIQTCRSTPRPALECLEAPRLDLFVPAAHRRARHGDSPRDLRLRHTSQQQPARTHAPALQSATLFLGLAHGLPAQDYTTSWTPAG